MRRSMLVASLLAALTVTGAKLFLPAPALALPCDTKCNFCHSCGPGCTQCDPTFCTFIQGSCKCPPNMNLPCNFS
jgi:hypothetical protein